MKKGKVLQPYVIRYLQGEDTLNEIMENIDPMVASIIMQYKCKCEYEDLYQTAWVTIMKCLQNYNVEAGILFSTYCYRAICNDIIIAENKERANTNKYNEEGQCVRGLVSKDMLINTDEDTPVLLENVIPNKDWEVSRRVIFNDLSVQVFEIAEQLSPSAKKVVLDYLDGKRQCDIARELNVTYAYVSKVIREFIEKCQHEFNK